MKLDEMLREIEVLKQNPNKDMLRFEMNEKMHLIVEIVDDMSDLKLAITLRRNDTLEEIKSDICEYDIFLKDLLMEMQDLAIKTVAG